MKLVKVDYTPSRLGEKKGCTKMDVIIDQFLKMNTAAAEVVEWEGSYKHEWSVLHSINAAIRRRRIYNIKVVISKNRPVLINLDLLEGSNDDNKRNSP